MAFFSDTVTISLLHMASSKRFVWFFFFFSFRSISLMIWLWNLRELGPLPITKNVKALHRKCGSV